MGMEPTTALMFIVVAASIGLFAMALSRMFKTFQKVESGGSEVDATGPFRSPFASWDLCPFQS